MSHSDEPNNSAAGLAWALGIQAAKVPSAEKPLPSAAGLASLLGIQATPPANTLAAIVEGSIRRRSEWNDRFAHWERSESGSETRRIERARDMVQQALSRNTWLESQGVRLAQQGSFTNRTNTRLESDIDLRVQHPDLKVTYAYGVDEATAKLSYIDVDRTYGDTRDRMRQEILSSLTAAFGPDSVDGGGSKAIRVNGLEGSRSEVDVVPCFTLHHVTSASLLGGAAKYEGAAIFSRDNTWTFNYPDQHIANGRAKRVQTGHQFKRVVRIVKRLQSDMVERGGFEHRVPSFLIECLVYCVEDEYFKVEGDDRFSRVQRVLRRISDKIASVLSAACLCEINGIKPLFGSGQAWTHGDAQRFVHAALHHMGNA